MVMEKLVQPSSPVCVRQSKQDLVVLETTIIGTLNATDFLFPIYGSSFFTFILVLHQQDLSERRTGAVTHKPIFSK